MQYFSTNRISPPATFREAVLAGQPSDQGLFFPSAIPRCGSGFIHGLSSMENDSIAYEIIRPYVEDEIPANTLREICSETGNFEFPLVPITDRISTLELFHGPTLAFKDVGARFMSRCLQHFSRDTAEKTIVIVATSGDTGGAVAAGFHGVEGIEVVILFPKGKVSRIQELQLTNIGGNVTTLELHGSFDDCQAIAKRALGDADLRSKACLTSANSINVARWLPQQFYYFFALKQWEGAAPVISVPSGNFGNLASGILAWRSGLPVAKFVAACNANDVVPRFLANGVYEPHETIPTLSNAMDVGSPSNFVRIMEMFNNDFEALKQMVDATTIDDATTSGTIREVFDAIGYTLDPHGAVAYRALEAVLERQPNVGGIFLETAHPVKFDTVAEIIGREIDVPLDVKELESRPRGAIEVDNDYEAVRDIILTKI